MIVPFDPKSASPGGATVWAFAIAVRETCGDCVDEVPALFRLYTNHSDYVGEVSDAEILLRATSTTDIHRSWIDHAHESLGRFIQDRKRFRLEVYG